MWSPRRPSSKRRRFPDGLVDAGVVRPLAMRRSLSMAPGRAPLAPTSAQGGQAPECVATPEEQRLRRVTSRPARAWAPAAYRPPRRSAARRPKGRRRPEGAGVCACVSTHSCARQPRSPPQPHRWGAALVSLARAASDGPWGGAVCLGTLARARARLVGTQTAGLVCGLMGRRTLEMVRD